MHQAPEQLNQFDAFIIPRTSDGHTYIRSYHYPSALHLLRRIPIIIIFSKGLYTEAAGYFSRFNITQRQWFRLNVFKSSKRTRTSFQSTAWARWNQNVSDVRSGVVCNESSYTGYHTKTSENLLRDKSLLSLSIVTLDTSCQYYYYWYYCQGFSSCACNNNNTMEFYSHIIIITTHSHIPS